MIVIVTYRYINFTYNIGFPGEISLEHISAELITSYFPTIYPGWILQIRLTGRIVGEYESIFIHQDYYNSMYDLLYIIMFGVLV